MIPRLALAAPPLLLLGCEPDQGVAVHNSPPVVDIVLPADGSTVYFGGTVSFVATVSDGESANEELDYLWTSDIDGILDGNLDITAEGVTFEMEGGLSQGTQNITLTAIDPSAESGSDSVSIEVLVNEPPKISFIEPREENTYVAYEPVQVLVMAQDTEEKGDLSGLALTWGDFLEGNPDAPATTDTQGLARFYLYDLGPGDYALSVTVTDPAGATGSAGVTLHVE